MTPTGKTFTGMLWPSHENLCGASDEFVVAAEGFRVRLMGTRLDLSFEASGPCSPALANALAEMYVKTLAKHLVMPLTLMTVEEWLKRTTPPFGNNMTMFYANREDPSRVASAVKAARNELLASADETLRRCYDYLQDARECMRLHDDKGAHVAVYEAMEVLETPFKNIKERVTALGTSHKEAKTAANAKRHIPEKVKRQPKSNVGPVELATKVIRRYERYLLDQHQSPRSTVRTSSSTP